MNLYNPPRDKAALFELALSEIWAASAKAEGHSKRLPDFPPRRQEKYQPTQADRDNVLSAIRVGRCFSRDISRFTGSGKMVTAATVAALVSEGVLKFSVGKFTGSSVIRKYFVAETSGTGAKP